MARRQNSFKIAARTMEEWLSAEIAVGADANIAVVTDPKMVPIMACLLPRALAYMKKRPGLAKNWWRSTEVAISDPVCKKVNFDTALIEQLCVAVQFVILASHSDQVFMIGKDGSATPAFRIPKDALNNLGSFYLYAPKETLELLQSLVREAKRTAGRRSAIDHLLVPQGEILDSYGKPVPFFSASAAEQDSAIAERAKVSCETVRKARAELVRFQRMWSPRAVRTE